MLFATVAEVPEKGYPPPRGGGQCQQLLPPECLRTEGDDGEVRESDPPD